MYFPTQFYLYVYFKFDFNTNILKFIQISKEPNTPTFSKLKIFKRYSRFMLLFTEMFVLMQSIITSLFILDLSVFDNPRVLHF